MVVVVVVVVGLRVVVVVVGAAVVVDVGAEVVVWTWSVVAVVLEVVELVPVSGPGMTGFGSPSLVVLDASEATMANSVASTTPAAPRTRYGGRSLR